MAVGPKRRTWNDGNVRMLQEHFSQNLHVFQTLPADVFAQKTAHIRKEVKRAFRPDKGKAGNALEHLNSRCALVGQLIADTVYKRIFRRRKRCQSSVLDDVAGIGRRMTLEVADSLDYGFGRGKKPCSSPGHAVGFGE